MSRQRYTVTITETGGRGRVFATRVLAGGANAAFGAGLCKLFGRRVHWQPDSGLVTGDPSYGYGQVFESLPNTGSGWSATSRTGRARFNVAAGW
jgi:hypothetical protein